MKTRPLLTSTSSALFLVCLTAITASASTVLVSENFGGASGSNLNGTGADTFDSAVTTAGGSSTWVAKTTDFRADGSVVGTGTTTSRGGSAHLNLGSYVNDARGTASGYFILTVTLPEVTSGSWLTLGFATENSPNVFRNFVNSPPSGSGSTTGLSTILRRSTSGEVDAFVGSGSGGNVQGPSSTSGSISMTVELDLTLWDGSTNFGTVSFASNGSSFGSANALSAANDDFGSILLSHAGNGNTTGNAEGSFSSLTLTQIPEPSTTTILGLIGLVGLLRRRRE